MDSATYNDWAKSMVLSGDWIGSQPFFMTPFYPYFLAVLYTVFGMDLSVIRIAQIVLGSGTAVLVYLIAARLFSRRSALIAGCLAAVYGPLVFFVNLLLVETVKVFFGTLTLYLVLRAFSSKKPVDYVYSGLSLGAAILCRPTDALMVIPIISAILFFSSDARGERIRRSIMVLAGIALLIAPVTLRNFLLSGEIIAVTSNGGLNFYIGNNADAVGVFHNPEQFNLVHDPNGSGYLQHQFGRPFTHGQTSSYWTAKALSFITEHPGAFSALMMKKFLLFFHHKEIGQLGYGYDFMAQHISRLLLFLPAFIIVLPLSVLGMAVFRRRWKELFLLHGFVWMQVAGVVLFFITDRYRLSAMPFFIIFAGGGADWLWNAVKERKRLPVMKAGGVMAAAVMLGTVFNVPIADDFSSEYYNIGLTYFEAHRYQDAVAAYRSSLSVRESYSVYNSLGDVHAAVGNFPLARQAYGRAFELNRSEPVSLFSIGTLFVRSQQWDSALVYYNRSLAVNPRFAPARLNKGLTLYYLQRLPEALAELEQYVELETDRTKTASVRRDIENLRALLRDEQGRK
jgi:4-amino-4-deoxy-L-arabinose transferase-like glycosyltransferase